MKRQPTEQERIFANTMTNKGLIANGYNTKTQETKVKINKWNYIKLKKPLHSKGNNQQNEKSAYEKGENKCKTYILKRITIQNICK